MTPAQLRQALTELNGERACAFGIMGMPESAACLTVQRAMLVPEETDHLVKLTDGASIYIIDAERVAWIRIGLADTKIK
ncbi:MAG: hypothetical protein ACF8R7_09710 [Phycisphaerales bacterium JB039]